MKTASWVIVSTITGKAIVETWDADKAAWINANAASQARAVPIGEWLASLNQDREELSPGFREELTPAGVQLVIPGCEREAPTKGRHTAQLSLW